MKIQPCYQATEVDNIHSQTNQVKLLYLSLSYQLEMYMYFYFLIITYTRNVNYLL